MKLYQGFFVMGFSLSLSVSCDLDIVQQTKASDANKQGPIVVRRITSTTKDDKRNHVPPMK